MAAVAAEAGSSVGALYTRVPDKRTLVRAVQLRLLARLLAAIDAAAADERALRLPADALVEALVAAAVGVLGERAGAIRAVIFQAVRDPVMRERANRALAHATAALAGVLERRGHAEPELTADVAVRILTGVLQQRIVLEREIDDATLIAELRRALAGYILSDRSGAAGRSA